jgi:hypothetical protein
MTHSMATRVFARITPAATAAFAVVMAMTPLFGQSLADLARQERAKKAQEKKPEKVFTNDDIPSTPSITTSGPPREKEGVAKTQAGEAKTEGDETEGAAPGEGKKGAVPAEDKAAAEGRGETKNSTSDTRGEAENKEPEKPKQDSAADMAKLEKEYRGRFKALRDDLAYQQQKLDVMQRELNLMQTQYYADPNVAMREQTFRGQINQRTQEIEQQKANVDKAQKAISDLEDELRKKGLPAGWSR